MKKRRILAVLVTAIMMVVSMSITSFAAENDAGYVVSQPTASGTINVKVVVETKKADEVSGNAFYHVYDVALNSGYTVRDVMFKLSRDEGEFGIYDKDYNYVWDSTDPNYIYALQAGNDIYAPSLLTNNYNGVAQDGLKFRVNGKYPLITWNGESDIGPIGANMFDTPVNDGDVIHFYWDCPRAVSPNLSAFYSVNYINANATYNNGTITATLKQSYNYFANINDCWVISPYGSCGSSYAGSYPYRIFKKGSNTVEASGTIVIDNNGSGAITGLSLASADTYYIEIATQTFRTPIYAQDNTPVVILENTNVFSKIQ